jgi:L-histidine N-alpha-methyltransferase
MSPQTHAGVVERLVVRDLTAGIAAGAFAEDVRAGLTSSPKHLSPKYFYDELGLTAAFNRNLLVRINRELGGSFDVTKFKHRAVYNAAMSRMEMHLISLEDQVAFLGALDIQVRFARGESIHTQNSYKFDVDDLARLAADAGFVLAKTWFDSGARFSFSLLVAGENVA